MNVKGNSRLFISIVLSGLLSLGTASASADQPSKEWIKKYGSEAAEAALKAAAQQWTENFIREGLNGERKIPGLDVADIARERLGDTFAATLDFVNYVKLFYDFVHGDHDAVFKGMMGRLASLNPYTAALWFVTNISASFHMARVMKELEEINAQTTQYLLHIEAIRQTGAAAYWSARVATLKQYQAISVGLQNIQQVISTECSMEKESRMSKLTDLFACWEHRSEFLTRFEALKPYIAEIGRIETILKRDFGVQVEPFVNGTESIANFERPYEAAIDNYHIVLANLLKEETLSPENIAKGSRNTCTRSVNILAQRSVSRALRIVNHMASAPDKSFELRELEKQYQLLQLNLWQCSESSQRLVNKEHSLAKALLVLENLLYKALPEETNETEDLPWFEADRQSHFKTSL